MQDIFVYLPTLYEKIQQHLLLTFLSTFFATSAGVPLGILTIKCPKLKALVFGFVNIFQTIPSLALLAFLIPVFGIGLTPALITLSLYAMLPIVRNTHSGIASVPTELIEAADGIGFKPGQKLWMVELPIALPLIIAGIRTAAVMSVGLATVAAFIGAGGLGDFIFQGISTNNSFLIFLGAIPAAILALVTDLLLGKAEMLFSTSNKSFLHVCAKYKKPFLWILSVVLLIFSVYFGKEAFQNTKKVIVIGTKNFTEQFILGEMIAQLLEEKSQLKIKRKFNLGTTDVCHESLQRGEIDMYPEYTGVGLTVVLKESPPIGTSDEKLLSFLDQQYQKRYGLKWFKPFGFENRQSLTVREDFAKRYNVKKISDLLDVKEELKIAAAAEFIQRPDAYDSLKKGYHLKFHVKQMAPALMYPALLGGHVNMIAAFSTDARIKVNHLKILEDDKKVFPKYQAAIVINQKTLEVYPEIQEILKPLEGLIDEATMQRLNYDVEFNKKSPYQVAKNFLYQKELL